MKIEKMNENQIRCTLTKEDLEQRHIKLSELAYGTAKAKSLFREMMRWASYKFGFEAEDIPLMIEAIPISSESIVLIVTKVPYPEELDPRFSQFSAGDATLEEDDFDSDADWDEDEDFEVPAYQPRPTLPKLKFQNTAKDDAALEEDDRKKQAPLIRIFRFDTLEDVIRLSHILTPPNECLNHLFKSPTDTYELVLERREMPAKEFNRMLNIISEYGTASDGYAGSANYINEQHIAMIRNNALQSLASL